MENKFRKTYRPLTKGQTGTIDQIKDKAAELDLLIYEAAGTMRETNIALTKLEEVVMWAVKAISA